MNRVLALGLLTATMLLSALSLFLPGCWGPLPATACCHDPARPYRYYCGVIVDGPTAAQASDVEAVLCSSDLTTAEDEAATVALQSPQAPRPGTVRQRPSCWSTDCEGSNIPTTGWGPVTGLIYEIDAGVLGTGGGAP